MCYKSSQDCWGHEEPIIHGSRLATACQAHKNGPTRHPVIRVEVHHGIMKGYTEIEEYLTPFIREELGDTPGVSIYGIGEAEMPVEVYAWKHGLAKGSGEPTHMFIAWDFEDEEIFNRLDGFLDAGITVESVTI